MIERNALEYLQQLVDEEDTLGEQASIVIDNAIKRLELYKKLIMLLHIEIYYGSSDSSSGNWNQDEDETVDYLVVDERWYRDEPLQTFKEIEALEAFLKINTKNK